MSGDECGVNIDKGLPRALRVSAPYNVLDPPPAGLQMVLALLDGNYWPLQTAGDTGVGVNAELAEGGIGGECNETITARDPGPIPNGLFPDPPNYSYPNIGVTAYGCQLNCDYIIVGNLGANVIVGKIDGQWHILKVLSSATTTPMFGPDNDCRCCGNNLRGKKLRARIISVSPPGGEYQTCVEFRIDPRSNELGYNPMGLTLSCGSRPESLLEDLQDWNARAFGEEAEVLEVQCCGEYENECDDSGGSGSGNEPCRFQATIQFTHEGRVYQVLMYVDPQDTDPCVRFEDEIAETVVAEAAGLPDLDPGDRVIMVKIPGGLAGREQLSGEDPVEWFIIRACNERDCANPCDEVPPIISQCCGKPCNELPNTLTATIEVIDSDCVCTSSAVLGATLVREGQENADCSGAAEIIWVVAPTSNTTFDEIAGCINDPGGVPPTKVRLANLQLKCGDARVDACGDQFGSSLNSGSDLGPTMTLTVYGFGSYAATGVASTTIATQDRTISCCSPFFLQYEVTGPFCYGAGASTVGATTTLRITITG